MNIKLDERLKEYMEEKGYKNILITPMICHTWGGSRLEISARFVDENEAALLSADHFQSVSHELGEVVIRRIPAYIDNVVTLGLSRFIKRITVEGIRSA